MTNQKVETINSKANIALVTLATIVILAGVLAFSLLSDQAMPIRLGALVAGIVLGLVIAWFSETGKALIAYARTSVDELKRVIWPTRKETLNMTGIVMAFVFVLAFFLFAVDKVVEWGLYDVLLRLSI